ncbi:hypothetical protein PVAP13_7NG056300 [Panicum virgatum]|uniref:Uncharacterized protein n=1 Tax=Panicum virgatum TaxID=38727 RepID=A0A8T0PRS8_PANVG|nr:hypothetical protein PVAP13_7NG056300 [Panicum virgatum]
MGPPSPARTGHGSAAAPRVVYARSWMTAYEGEKRRRASAPMETGGGAAARGRGASVEEEGGGPRAAMAAAAGPVTLARARRRGAPYCRGLGLSRRRHGSRDPRRGLLLAGGSIGAPRPALLLSELASPEMRGSGSGRRRERRRRCRRRHARRRRKREGRGPPWLLHPAPPAAVGPSRPGYGGSAAGASMDGACARHARGWRADGRAEGGAERDGGRGGRQRTAAPGGKGRRHWPRLLGGGRERRTGWGMAIEEERA